MIELPARAILAYFFTLALACILAFEGGYRLKALQTRHLIMVQEVTEIQDGILEDCEEFRWRLDSLEVHQGMNGAEITSLKKIWLKTNTERRRDAGQGGN